MTIVGILTEKIRNFSIINDTNTLFGTKKRNLMITIFYKSIYYSE